MIENHTHGDDGQVVVIEEASPEELAADAAVKIAEIEASKEIALAEIAAGSQEQILDAEVVETAMEVEAEFDSRAEIAALRDEFRLAIEEMRAEKDSSEPVIVSVTPESESFEDPAPAREPRGRSKSNAWFPN